MMDTIKQNKKTAMNKYITKMFFVLILLFAAGCEKADELPPVNESYSLEYILPEATPLTDQDRTLIEEQENEYSLNAK